MGHDEAVDGGLLKTMSERELKKFTPRPARSGIQVNVSTYWQATAQYKELGSPSHSEIQIARNSKPQLNTKSLELQAIVKYKELGTPSHSEIQIDER